MNDPLTLSDLQRAFRKYEYRYQSLRVFACDVQELCAVAASKMTIEDLNAPRHADPPFWLEVNESGVATLWRRSQGLTLPPWPTTAVVTAAVLASADTKRVGMPGEVFAQAGLLLDRLGDDGPRRCFSIVFEHDPKAYYDGKAQRGDWAAWQGGGGTDNVHGFLGSWLKEKLDPVPARPASVPPAPAPPPPAWTDGYEDMSRPFDTVSQARAAEAAFVEAVRQARVTHRIADVHLVYRMTADNNEVAGSFHFGNDALALPLAAMALGAAMERLDAHTRAVAEAGIEDGRLMWQGWQRDGETE